MASLSRTATACGAITVRTWANVNVSASLTRVAVAVMTLKHGERGVGVIRRLHDRSL